MSILNRPAIVTPDDLLLYTGVPNIPKEKADPLTPEERKKGGKRARKVISGVSFVKNGNRKNGRGTWRVEIAKSGPNAKRLHDAFTYDCPTKEEAAFIASMAHRVLKPQFAQACRDGDEKNEPAGPGHYKFFWNNIWNLWKYCRLTTPTGDYLAGAIPGAVEGERRVFVTDWREDIYARLVQAPLFNRRTVYRIRNYEPVQPEVYRTYGSTPDRFKAAVDWTRLSQIVLGESMEIPPARLIGFDYRRDALMGLDVTPIWPGVDIHPEGWIPPLHPESFNSVVALADQYAHHHPYGVTHIKRG
ncbi:MAG: hypothetical protein ACSHX9_08050 [Luteolibacter sp.]